MTTKSKIFFFIHFIHPNAERFFKNLNLYVTVHGDNIFPSVLRSVSISDDTLHRLKRKTFYFRMNLHFPCLFHSRKFNNNVSLKNIATRNVILYFYRHSGAPGRATFLTLIPFGFFFFFFFIRVAKGNQKSIK